MLSVDVFVLLIGAATVATAADIVVDDTNPSIVYKPAGQTWTRHVDQDTTFELYNNSDTFTSTYGATITWKFNGTYIEYWSNTGPYHGPCSVQLDGKSYGNVTSNADKTGAPILLFSQEDLADDEEHTIVIKVVAQSYPNVCEIDRFVYTPVRAVSSKDGSGTSSGDHSAASNTNDGPPWAAIGGGVGAIVVLALLALWLLFWRRKRSKVNKSDSDSLKGLPTTQPTLPVITPMSEPDSPFISRPISVSSSSPYGTAIPPGLFVPPTARHSIAVDRAPVQMPLAHPYDIRRHSSAYGAEPSYQSSLASPAPSSVQPLLSRNSTHSSHTSYSPPTTAPAGTRPLSPGRPQFVLSATSELGEPEYDSIGDVKTPPKPVEAPQAQSQAGSSTLAATSAPTARPVIQHSDAGAAADASPEELPPAYNEQWQGGSGPA
ncbi:hypothetical protein EXIGLDRAFT_834729 [Exidia glandulosa HHB12029]|uniref:Mid2 domain-containing protein n=1 Tax=Exidia glandulosa HHB12029 TaxID=1314781 RepID=A0A165JIT0_EXIGL|nr:hypothetical protein EXIGLDRAFT_834729 [Exidia glandulosa HHB12029]